MSKGSNRRPQDVSEEAMQESWDKVFKPPVGCDYFFDNKCHVVRGIEVDCMLPQVCPFKYTIH